MAKSKSSVVDASYMLAFLLPDERTEEVTDTFAEIFFEGHELISTNLLPFEVLNGLKTAVLRKRLDSTLAGRLAKEFFKLEIALRDIDFEETLTTAVKKGLTVYDAGYIVLARSEHSALLSLDHHLQKLV